MSIEDPRLSSIDNTSAADDFDSAVEQHLGYASETVGGIEVAQAETPDATRTDRLPAQTPPVEVAAATIPTEVKPNEQNVVTLPAGIELDNLEFEVDGENLVLVLADGTEIVVLGGAANIPTFVIGELELPQVALFAALEESNINVAAGTDGTFSAQGSPSASRNLVDNQIDATPEDLALAELLGDTSFGDELRTAVILGAEGDTEPTFLGATAGGVDEDYLKGGNINDGQTGGASSFTGSLGIDWGSDDDNVDGNTGLSNPFDRGVAFTQATLDALISEGYTSDGIELQYELSADGTTIIAYKLVVKGGNGEGGGVQLLVEAPGDSAEQPIVSREDVFEVSVSDAADGSYTFTLKGNLDHPDGSTEDDITIEFPFTAQDSDGDQASSTFTVTVNDDSPVIDDKVDADGVVSEDYLRNGNVDEGNPEDLYKSASEDLGIRWGADNDFKSEAFVKSEAPGENLMPSGDDPIGRTLSFAGLDTSSTSKKIADAIPDLVGLSSDKVDLSYRIDYARDKQGNWNGGYVLIAYKEANESEQAAKVVVNEKSEYAPGTVFVITLDPTSETGSYTFKLIGNLDHAAPPEGAGDNGGNVPSPMLVSELPGADEVLSLNIPFTATDSDGDSIDGNFTLAVIDDVPVPSGCKLVFTVDEDDIKTDLSTGTSPNDTAFWDDSYTGNPNLGNDRGPAYIRGSLTSLVKAGADGPVSFSFVTGTKATEALKTLADLGLYSKSDALSYRISGNVLEAYVAGGEDGPERVVFSLTLQPGGSFEFELFDQLDHDAPGDDEKGRHKPDADENVDLQDDIPGVEVTNINFGALIKATDGDDDSISLDGAFSIKIRDDIPEVNAKRGDERLVVDETAGSDEGDDETNTVAGLFVGVDAPGRDWDMRPQYASQQGMVTAAIKEGADDTASVTWALKLSNGNGTYSGLQTTDGRNIYLFIEDGLVVGRYDDGKVHNHHRGGAHGNDEDPAAFAIHIANDGTLSMVQYVSIKHDDRGDNDEANDNGTNSNDSQDYGLNDSPNPIQQTLANKVLAEVTVEDFDGDKATDTVEIGSRIVFQDDGPSVDLTLKQGASIVIDETDNSRAPGELDIEGYTLGIITVGADKIFTEALGYGADGAATSSAKVYSLSVSARGTDSGLVDTRTDASVLLFNNNGVIEGRAGSSQGQLVFSISVNSSTGAVTVTQLRAVEHSDENSYNELSTAIAAGKLQLTATVKDGDGDMDRDSIDLGTVIQFQDDGPSMSNADPLIVKIDEDGLPGNKDNKRPGEENGGGEASASASAGALTALFNFGSDGAHASQAISLKAATDVELEGWTSKSEPISVTVDGTKLVGMADGQVVFELLVNVDGSYTFTLKQQIDHDSLDDAIGDNTENLKSLDLSEFIIGKDGDGDTFALSKGKFVIDIRDDISVQTDEVETISLEAPQPTETTAGQVANFVLVLDTSGSVTIKDLQDQVEDFLNKVADSGAQDVRVHIVEFADRGSSIGTFDLISGGVKQAGELSDALTAIKLLDKQGDTNFEAGLQKAMEWIDGVDTVEITGRVGNEFDANSASPTYYPGYDDNRDYASIVGNGSTQVALVSGWQNSGTQLINANGSVDNGWGPAGGDTDTDVNPGQMLRFDFGAFNDFDGDSGVYNNAGNFAGIPVLSATFKLDDNRNGSNGTNFGYKIYFVGGGSQNDNVNVDNDATYLTLTGTGEYAGKQIAYVEFTIASGNGQGDIDLQTVTTPVITGDAPLLNADINKVIFIADGDPNRAFGENGQPQQVGTGTAIVRSGDEITAIETDSDATGPQQAFTIEAYGLNVGQSELGRLDDVEGPNGEADNLNGAATLAEALKDVIDGLSGTTTTTPGQSVFKGFDLSKLVAVGADENLSFSFKDGTSGLPSEIDGIELDYTFPDGVLTAKAGNDIVFTLSLSENGTGTFTLFQPLGSSDVNIDFSSVIQAEDHDGDAIGLTAGKFVVTVVAPDTTPPMVTITSDVDGPINVADGTVTYTFQFSEAVSGFTADDITVANGTKGTLTEVTPDTYTMVVTPTAGLTGNITVGVAAGVATDAASNPNVAATPYVQPVDLALPMVTITSSDLGTVNASDGTVAYTFKFSEAVSGFTADDITVANGTKGTLTEVTPDTYTMVVTPTAGFTGNMTVGVAAGVATDAASNPNVPATPYVQPVDLALPMVTITSSDLGTVNAADGTVTYTFKFSEAVSGFTADDITVANGTKGTLTEVTPDTYTMVVTPTAGFTGNMTVGVAAGVATDAASNPNVAATPYVQPVDLALPTVTITSSDLGTVTAADGTVTYTFQFSEAVSGFTADDISVENGTKGTFGQVDADTYTLVVTPNVNFAGNLTVGVAANVATDAASNPNVAATSFVQAVDTLVNQAPTDITFRGNVNLKVETTGVGQSHPDTEINPNQVLFTTSTTDADSGAFTYSFNGASTTSISTDGENGNIEIGSADGEVENRYKIDFDNGVQTITISNIRSVDTSNGSHTESMTLRLGTNNGNDSIDGSATSRDQVIYGFGGDDTINGGSGNDWIAGGAGKDTMTGGAGRDIFAYASGDSTADVTTQKFNKVDYVRGISDFDVIRDFNVSHDKLELPVAVRVATDAAKVDGQYNSDRAWSQNVAIRSHSIANGIITFDDLDDFASALSVDTSERLGMVVQYLQRNDLGGAGTTVAFHATFDGVASTFVYQQSGTERGAASGYTLVALRATTIINFNDLVSDDAIDPIILDLDKNGFAFSSIGDGVTFDINADGKGDQIAWTSDDGILAYDVDGNGLIDNGSEIFTPEFNGGKFASGVAALASLDSNKDGKIDASDDAFSELQVWVDADNDGISDEGELSSLSANGVASISLTTDQTGGEEDGQTVFAEGEFTFADGSTGNFLEVGFDTIFGSENDGLTLHGGMGEVVMTGSAGADTFVFDGTALDELDVADVITDFSTEEGDVLDVTALLDRLLGEQPDATVETHLRATVEGGNTTVSVQAEPGVWKDVVELQNHDTAIKVLFDDKHAVVTPHD